MSDLTLNQIQALLREGLTADEVAEQLGLEPALVAALGEKSEGASRARVTVGADVAAEMLEGIVDLARHAESEIIRMRARQYVVDDFKGRLDKRDAGVNVNINIAEINDGLKRSRARILDKARAAAGVLAERVAAVNGTEIAQADNDTDINL